MHTRGIRGATTATGNTPDAIRAASRELLRAMAEANAVCAKEIVSIIFTTTDQLDAEFPAVAAREMGWEQVPLLCAREIPVPGSLGFCIRVLMHVNTQRSQDEMRHVYLHEAASLRPDLPTTTASHFSRVLTSALEGGNQ